MRGLTVLLVGCCLSACLRGAGAGEGAAPDARPVVGLVASADEADLPATAGVRVVVGRATGPWGSAGAIAVALVREHGALVLVAPEDPAMAHEVVQVAGRLRVRVFTACAAPSLRGTGSPWGLVVPGTTRDALAVASAVAGLPGWVGARVGCLVRGVRALGSRALGG